MYHHHDRDQCWIRESLNYGSFIASVFTNDEHTEANNKGVVEYYGVDNDIANIIVYSALNDWNELMSFNSAESGQEN